MGFDRPTDSYEPRMGLSKNLGTMRSIWLKLFTVLLMTLCACGEEQPSHDVPVLPEKPEEPVQPEEPEIGEFFVGTTMSFANYLIDCGLEYREAGVITNPYASVRASGANIVRLQLDRQPFEDVEGAKIDWQQWERVVEDAQCAKAEGLDIVLTLKPDYDKYTSSSASHNHIPEDWKMLSEVELGGELYNWVYDSLEGLYDEGIVPRIVAVGNEVNLGFLLNGANDAGRTARLLNYGHGAVRDFAHSRGVEILLAVHIANPAHIGVVQEYKDNGAVNYDIVALSWYPGKDIGHSMGTYSTFKALGAYVRAQFGKRIMVLETAYSFTTGTVDGEWMGDWCDNSYNYPDWNEATNAQNYTPVRQRAWLRALAEDVKAGGGVGVITWGTESLPDKLDGKEPGHGLGIYTYPAAWGYGSTWENNSYWDFTDGNNLHEGILWMKDVTDKVN